MRGLLVCGGRDFRDAGWLYDTLDEVWADRRPDLLVVGGCRYGADELARQWAARREHICVVHPAEWEKYGKAAGPKRNADMLALWKPSYVVAFPGGSGTQGMLSLARKADGVLRVLDLTQGQDSQ